MSSNDNNNTHRTTSKTKLARPSTFNGTLTPAVSAAIACLEGILSKEDFSHIYSENAVIHFPYAASIGWRSKLKGIQQIQDFLVHRLPSIFKDWKMEITAIHPSSDPLTATIQWKASSIVIPTGKRYKQQYIAVVTVNEEGKITLVQEFWNPKVVEEAFNQSS